MLLPFTKAHGTGNSFIVIYLPDVVTLKMTKNLIQKLCNVDKGIGADGLLIIDNHKNYDYKMDYYNNDGTWETMCANGARCVGLFLYKKKIIKKQATFITGDGLHHIKIINDNNIALTMCAPKYVNNEIYIEGLYGISVDSGAKHFVVEVKENIDLDWKNIGRKIRYSHHFKNGTNVNFVKKINQNTLKVITYEKGIEKIMQSCGSGSLAAAYHMQKKYNLDYNLTIQTQGGLLYINSDEKWNQVWLEGPAKLLFNSKIEIKNNE